MNSARGEGGDGNDYIRVNREGQAIGGDGDDHLVLNTGWNEGPTAAELVGGAGNDTLEVNLSTTNPDEEPHDAQLHGGRAKTNSCLILD